MRLGVFGGSFDPIHFGHLRMAEAVRERFGLDRVLFIPNAVSPFKTDISVTAGAVRAELLQLATRDNPYFQVWTGELDRPGPSYTVDTLRRLDAENPGADLYFLTGSDAVRDLMKWREPKSLVQLAHFIAVIRPGVSEDDVRGALPDDLEARIAFLALPGLDISATEIRARVAVGHSIRYLVPPEVIDAIARHGLYRGA
jgi:nicotinate-nucleotide adenylyltransferase